MNFIWYILIGILAGYFAGKIMRGGGFGLLDYFGCRRDLISLDSLLLQPLPVRGVFLATRQYRLLWLYKN